MLYGALPGTVTGKLSVPHQNPGGPSPADNRSAAVTAGRAPAVTVAEAAAPLVITSARQATRVSPVRLMMPPGVDPLTSRVWYVFLAAALQRGLLRMPRPPPGPREAEGGQGARIVQDRGA